MRPLPAWAEGYYRVRVQVKIDAANTTAGSGLHDATCSIRLHLLRIIAAAMDKANNMAVDGSGIRIPVVKLKL